MKILADSPGIAAAVIARHREAKIDRWLKILIDAPPPQLHEGVSDDKQDG